MHHLVAAQNGISGAGFDAQGATNAPCLVNHGHGHGAFYAVVWIERERWQSGNVCQKGNALYAPRRALIDRGLVLSDGLRVGLAIGKAASSALRLGQRIVDAFGQRFHFLREGAFLATAFTVALVAVLLEAFVLTPKSLCAKMNLTTAGYTTSRQRRPLKIP